MIAPALSRPEMTAPARVQLEMTAHTRPLPESFLDEEPEGDKQTMDEDGAHITEAQQNEELAALEAEADLPLDVILKMYAKTKDSSNQANGCGHEPVDSSSDDGNSSEEVDDGHSYAEFVKSHGKSNGNISSMNDQEDEAYIADEEDDKASLSEEEELAKKEYPNHLEEDDKASLSEEEELAKQEDPNHLEEIKLLQKESEIPLEELLAQYRKDGCADHETAELENSPHCLPRMTLEVSKTQVIMTETRFLCCDMLQYSKDMKQTQIISQVIEHERIMNHLAVLIGALDRAGSHTVPTAINGRKFLHGWLKFIYLGHAAAGQKDYVYYEKDQVLMRSKQEEIAKECKMSWLVDVFRRKEHERRRSEVGEKEEQAFLDQCNSHAVVIDVEKTKKTLVYVNHMHGRLSLVVDTSQSCIQLRELIEKNLRYSLDNHILRFGCKLLDNEMSLHSHGVSHTSVLDLCPKLLGGCHRVTLHDYVNGDVSLVNTISIPDPQVRNQTQNVENLSMNGCRLAKSLVDIFVEAHRELKTWGGNIDLKDFTVHNGRAEVTKLPTGGFSFEEWQSDCKKLAAILKRIFTRKPIYVNDLIDTLEGVKSEDMHLEWLKTYIQNHLAFALSFNRSNVSAKLIQMYESLTPTDQVNFKGIVNYNVKCHAWYTNKVHNAHIFSATLQHHTETYGRTYELTSFGRFRFQRNFTTHASEEKKVNGIAKFSWTRLEYVTATFLGNFVPEVIKALVKSYDLCELLQSAVPF